MRGGRNRTQLMERMLFGVFNSPENRRHSLFPTNNADAQAILEILIETHAPDWTIEYNDEFDPGEVDEDDFGDWQDEDEDEDDLEIQDDVYFSMDDMISAMGFGPAGGQRRREIRADEAAVLGRAAGAGYARRNGAPQPEENDEMPRLVDVDDLD